MAARPDVVEQVAQREQAGAGALEDRDPGRAQPGRGGLVDGGGQPGQHRDRLGRARGRGQRRQRVGLVAVELGHQVHGQRDRGHGRVGGQRGQALGEQRLGVAAGPPHVQRVGRGQARVEHRGQPGVRRRGEGGERHAEFGGQVGGVRAFQPGVVHGRDALAGGGAPARGEELQGVGQFGQVADAVQAVGAGQRLPRAVGRGQRAGVGRHQRLAGLGRAHAEQHHRHVRGQRVRQHRAQPGRVPDRLEDQGQHLGLGELQRVPGVVRGRGDELLAGGDGQAEAEAAARPQQRGEHRTRVRDQRDRPGWQRVGLDVADGPQAAGDVHEPHAPRAAHGHARLPGDRGQPAP